MTKRIVYVVDHVEVWDYPPDAIAFRVANWPKESVTFVLDDPQVIQLRDALTILLDRYRDSGHTD